MDLWMLGVALSALVVLGVWDVGRPGRAEPSAQLFLRAVGGLGLVAMAGLALQAGSSAGALVAAAAAAPLLLGLLGGALREPRQKPVARPSTAHREREQAPAPRPAEERRAA
jgi:hypothetical protein